MIKRWYKNKPFSYLSQPEASGFLFEDPTPDQSGIWSVGKAWMDQWVKNNPKGKGTEKIVQLIVNRNIEMPEGPPAPNDTAIFSPDSLKSPSFIDKVKNDAVKVYLSYYGFENKDSEEVAEATVDIKSRLVVTNRFYITTGKPGMLKLQVLGIEIPEVNDALRKAADAPNPDMVKTYNYFNFVRKKDNNTLRILSRILKLCATKNSLAKTSYAYDFESLRIYVRKHYHELRAAKWGDPIDGLQKFSKAAKIEYEFSLTSRNTYAFKSAAIFEELATRNKAHWFGSPPKHFNINTDDAFKGLIFNATAIELFYRNNGDDFDLSEFVDKFMVPVPTKQPNPVLAKKVYNNGEVKYKSNDDLARENLREEQKLEVYNSVKNKYNQVGDNAFLELIKNRENIQTIDDLYNTVVNVVPVTQIVEAAISCLLKAMSLADIKGMICDAILGKATLDDIVTIVKELDKVAGGEGTKAVGELKAYLVEKTQGTSNLAPAVRNEIINTINSDLTYRDIICAVILAAFPAAIALLVKYARLMETDPDALGDDIKNALTDVIEDKIVNPAKEFLEKVEDTVEAFVVTTLTTDWAQVLKTVVLEFVEQFILLLIKNILDEIAELCEGSSTSDFANMGVESFDNSIPEGLVPAFPIEPNLLTGFIDKSDGNPYKEWADFTAVDEAMIKDFMDALSEFLTLSEICSLISPDSNRNYLLEKVWYGLLSTPKFEPLKMAIGNIGNLGHLFFVLGNLIDKSLCFEALDRLEKTKKALADLCGPIKKDALIEDLKDKATNGAIESLLNQEDAIARNLLDNLLNLVDVTTTPPLFCGPEADLSPLPPIFQDQQHSSEKFLMEQLMDKMLQGVDNQFEQDLGFYKSILKMGGQEDKFKAASAQVAGAMSQLYGLSGNGVAPLNANALNQSLANNNIVASKVYNVLVSQNFGIQTVTNEGDNFIEITTTAATTGQGQSVNLLLNYDIEERNGVPPKTARFSFGPNAVFVDHSLEDNDYTKLSNLIISTDMSNPYAAAVKSEMIEGLVFFGELLQQTIQEHAEFIATQDLFKTSKFDKLQLTKLNVCDPSLLAYQPILDEMEDNMKAIQCKVNFTAVPSASEMVQINAILETITRVVTIQEFLKSLLVFSVYGVEALLPEEDSPSFYYEYLIKKVELYLTRDINADGISPLAAIRDYSRKIYAAKQGLPIEPEPPLTNYETVLEMSRKNMKEIQSKIKEKISISYDEGEYKTLNEEFNTDSPQNISSQVITNLITENIYGPPEIKSLDFATKVVTIPKGFYTNDARLRNGGFFIEEGYNVQHKYGGNAFTVNEIVEVVKKTVGDPNAQFDKNGIETRAFKFYKQLIGYGSDPKLAMFYAPGFTDEIRSTLKSNGLPGGDGNLTLGFENFAKLVKEASENEDTQGAIASVLNYRGKLDKSRFEPTQYQLTEVVGAPSGQLDFLGNPILEQSTQEWNRVPNTEGDYRWGLFQKSGENDNDIKAPDALPGDTVRGPDFLSYANEIKALIDGTEEYNEADWQKIISSLGSFGNTINQEIFLSNKVFSALEYYYSLNVLIPLPLVGGEDADVDILGKYLGLIVNTNGDEYDEGFLKTALNRQYIMREEETDNYFFKVPLVEIIENIGNTPSSLINLKEVVANKDIIPKTDLSASPLFKSFIKTFEYKSILSYVSVLTAETIESQYPELNNLFNRTIVLLEESLATLINIANRVNDPDFYKNLNFSPDIGNSSNINYFMLILDALMKALANTADPTWRTPWFLPGPLTPIGIIAKLLDGQNPSTDADRENNLKSSQECGE